MLKSLQGGALAVRGARAFSASPVTVITGRGGRSSTGSHTVTIFGATGRMGRYLVNNLGQIGTQMVIPHRCDPFNAQFLKVSSDLGQQHSIYTPDFNDDAKLEEVVKYSDVVVNLTGSHRPRIHHSFLDSNVTLTHRIARACKNAGVPTFIHMSHVNADPDSPSKFLQTKALSEEVVLHELPNAAIIVRLSDCFHAFDDFSHYFARTNSRQRLYKKGATQIYKSGLYTFKQPVYGPDAMKGVCNIIQTNDQDRHRLYQFVGPKTYSLNEFMEAITDITFRMYKPRFNRVRHLVEANILKHENYIRYQMVSDMPIPGLPGLEDVGVKPIVFEDKALFWLRNYRIFWQVWDPVDGQRSSIYGNTMGTGEGF